MAKSQDLTSLNDQTWIQASDWLLRFAEEEVDAAARENFNSWLRKSPENVHAYLQVSAFWRDADQLGSTQREPRDLDALVALARQEANVYPLEFGSHSELKSEPTRGASIVATSGASIVAPKSARRRRRFQAAAASMLVVSGLAAGVWHSQFGAANYSTEIGEQRILNLPDGSTVTLNADSRLKLRFSKTERAIELLRGQALFKVAKNPTRPFVVRSGTTSVRAVGTQFDVYRKKADTVVTVVEGKVAVNSAPSSKLNDVLIVAGHQVTVPSVSDRARASVESATAPPVVHSVEIKDAVAWTEGLLVFQRAPLEEVVREFNRQNAKPLVLEGNGLDAVRITGTFPASGSERITQFLLERHGVTIDESDDAIRISRR